MSIWNIGSGDVSEETQAFKDKLASKDGHIAAQQTRLMRQASELEELRSTLNDALHKLSRETSRALSLENGLSRCSEDLRNEKIASQNVEGALAAAQEKIKLKDLEAKELHSNLQSLSHTSDGHYLRGAKLEKEKGILEARVRELEANLRQLSCPPATPGRRAPLRPRSSSLSNFRITTLEQELRDVKETLSQREVELRLGNQKLSQAQGELIKVGNEKLAVEKRVSKQLADLQVSLEDKEEELRYMKEQEADGSREEELLRRIEEDDAKIAVLERMLGDVQGMEELSKSLQRVEQKLKEEMARASESEERHIELVREKEEALDELENTRVELRRLEGAKNQRESLITCTPEWIGNRAGNNASTTSLLDTEQEVQCPRPSTPVPQTLPDETAVVYIERLLAAIERLRAERDSLWRNLQFLESESKFTIAALESKLSTSSRSSVSDHQAETISKLQIRVDSLRNRLAQVVEHEAKTIRERDREVKRLGLVVTASAVVIGQLHSQAEHFQTVQDELQSNRMALVDLEERFKDMQIKLEVTVLCLEATTSQRNDLMTQLEAKNREREEQVGQFEATQKEARDVLKQAELQLVETSKALEDVESERDSLTLQITNLLTDLDLVKDDLANAESRYSSLQFHQLSSMPSNEATCALREQIGELEMRVMRRTEQIGIHQHDIRRLETNLRLQEERLGELNTEVETLAAQKDAMVEDCADARDARDEALVCIEGLEVEMEMLEGRVEEREQDVAALISVIVQTINRSRDAVRISNDGARQTNQELERLRGEHQNLLWSFEEKSLAALHAIQRSESSQDGLRQSILALAVSQAGMSKAWQLIWKLRQEKDTLRSQVQDYMDQLDSQDARVGGLMEQLESLNQQSSAATSRFAARTSELESEVQQLQQTILTVEATHCNTVSELGRSQESLQEALAEKEHSLVANDLQDELVRLKARYVEELGSVQACLLETGSALEELQTRHAHEQAGYERTLFEVKESKQDVERRLATVVEDLQQSRHSQEVAEQTGVEKSEEVLHLRRRLEAALIDAEKAQKSQDNLQAVHSRVLDDFSRAEQDRESQLTQAKEQSLAIQQHLEGELANLQSQIDKQSRDMEKSIEDANQIERELLAKIDTISRHSEMYARESRTSKELYARAESDLKVASQELVDAREQLEQERHNLKSLQEEKLSLQEEITTLEAKIQQSISHNLYLESQVKESEHTIMRLTGELEQTRGDLARFEKSSKAAEVNLSLQGVQYRREMANFQRELAVLRSRPNLQDTLAELEERNNEMEELLRSKCAEIEENDDRTLELLKENKKLTNKMESLTRKVQNLQAKLAAAKASMPKVAPETSQTALPPSTEYAFPTPAPVQPTPRPRSITITKVPPVPATPIYAPFPHHRALDRMVSGPSSLPRPKTPERRVPPPPVFKAQTPEKPIVATNSEVMLSAPTIGKKRRSPEDFEACESVPAQGFTAESVPYKDVEQHTPRMRRVLSGIQAGFTPVRNHIGRPTIPMPSPKRAATGSAMLSPMIADVTNSPRTVSQVVPGHSKRSWLGKIRGSSHAAGRSASSRPTFE